MKPHLVLSLTLSEAGLEREVALLHHKTISTCIQTSLGARTKRTFVFSFSGKKNQRCFVAFLGKLFRRWGKVCLFIDSGPGHQGKIVDEFLTVHQKTFRFVRFPKYCPELNPVEPCWKPARKVVGNRLITSVPAMKYHLRKIFRKPFLMPKMFKYLSN